MQLIGHGDLVVSALFVFLSVMLFASVYLFLIKLIDLSCRARHARRCLRSFAQARSLQQVRAFVDGQKTIKSFSRVAHHILVEKKRLDATAGQHGQASGAHGAAARRLIAHEAATQAADLQQGLRVLAAMVWAAPVTVLVAILWRATWLWLQPAQAQWKAGVLWEEAFALMQLGLAVAIIALAAYLCLLVANRVYLSQFVLFERMVMSLLEPDRDAAARATKPRNHFRRVWPSAPKFEV